MNETAINTSSNNAMAMFGRNWWILLVDGILMILGGMVLIIFPMISAAFYATFAGILLMFGGAFGIFRAFQMSGTTNSDSVFSFLAAILAGIIGFILVIHPWTGLLAVAEVVGIFAVVCGIMQIASGFGMSGRDHRGLFVLNGFLTIALGICMFLWPVAAIWVFSIFFGVELIFWGFGLIAASNGLRQMNSGAS